MDKRVWAIIGGGNGGQTMAGHLGLMGYKVRLFDVMQETVDEINKTKEIILHNAIEGVGKIEFATTDIQEAMDGADNIILVLPSIYHESMATKMAPFFKDGQVVLLHPETCGGAIAFRQALKNQNCKANIVVGSACNLLYATRADKPGKVHVFGVKKALNIAALPASDNQKLLDAVKDAFPMFSLVDNIMQISLDNLNAMMHPGPTLLCTSRIEGGEPFEYYTEGITPSIGKFIEAMDKERIALAEVFGFKQRNVRQEYLDQYGYGTLDNPVNELVAMNKEYKGIMAPNTMNVRYIFEDIPYNLQAFSALGKATGVPTPCIDAVIAMGRAMFGDKMGEGRTAKSMGIDKMTRDEVVAFIKG